jgi:ketosteroid isomerase-like protein
MSEMSNKKMMLRLIAAFGRNDPAPLLAAVSQDVVWVSNAPREFFRFGGTHRGVIEVKVFMATVYARYHFLRMEPSLIVTQGDIVWGQFDCQAKHIPSGRTVQGELAFRWTIRNGQIVAHEGFFDTASVLLQQGDIPAAA